MNSMNVFNTRYVSSTLPTAIILFQSNNKTDIIVLYYNIYVIYGKYLT